MPRVAIRLRNKETGTFYVTTKLVGADKMKLRKYDPKTRRHEWFSEEKMK